MANRRMISKDVIETDSFLDMPLSAQALYFHLELFADDDGFVNNPTSVQRMIGASKDDLKILIAKGFLIVFESGVVVITHWGMSNFIRKDRHKDTIYKKEMALLIQDSNDVYHLKTDTLLTTNRQPDDNQSATRWQPIGNQMATNRQPHDNQMSPQVSLGKDSLGKDIELVSLDKGDHSENQPTNNYPSDRDPNIHVQPDGSVSYGDNPVDCQSIINDFNKICKSHSKVTQLTANRERMIARMVIENHFTPETFHKLFTMFEQSDWLSGRGGTSRFSMTFDWLLKDDNAIKVLEGNYENFAAGTNKPGYTGNAYIDAINHRFDGIDEWAAKGDANDQK